MNTRRRLSLQLHGYWHVGGGRSAGHHLDALCEREDDLPVLPGRQLKGLLRHAVRRAENWGWLKTLVLPSGPATRFEELLFGSTTQQERRADTHPGLLQVASAQLPQAERAYLRSVDAGSLTAALFAELFSTAINDNGTAKARSLRGIEAVVPLTLFAELALIPTAQHAERRQQQLACLSAEQPWQVLECALPLLDHIGAHRNRGLGECTAQLTAADTAGA